MRPDQRIVVRTPIIELWNDQGSVAAERIRSLSENDLRELVRTTSLQFVVANVGNKLRWVPKDERFDFWKSIQSQIAEPSKPIYLAQFLNETAYSASEWRTTTGERLIVLETHH